MTEFGFFLKVYIYICVCVCVRVCVCGDQASTLSLALIWLVGWLVGTQAVQFDYIYIYIYVCFCPGPSCPSLINLVSSSSLQPTILMPGLMLMPIAISECWPGTPLLNCPPEQASKLLDYKSTPSLQKYPGHWSNKQSVRQWFGRLGFNPWSSHTKDSKNGTSCRLALHSAL